VEHRIVRRGEFGFLQTAASGVPAGFSLVVLPMLPVQRLMYHVLMVELHEGVSEQHLVVSAHQPRLDEAVCEQVRQVVSSRWPAAHTSFITDIVYEPEGPTCRCAVYFGQEGLPADVAAAVAESVRSGTLADIQDVSVTVDGMPHSVALSWAGTHATASILAGSSTGG
jgi:hypothetical protein